MITLKDFLTASGKYPERENHKEVTETVKSNSIALLWKINAFLTELGIDLVIISSGFRPSEVNNKTANAAKRSLHMEGRAIDIADPDGSLDALVDSRDDLKKKYGIWQESPKSTNGWCHLDDKDRGKRDKNTFNP